MPEIHDNAVIIRDRLEKKIYLNEEQISKLIKPLKEAFSKVWRTLKGYFTNYNGTVKNTRAATNNVAVAVGELDEAPADPTPRKSIKHINGAESKDSSPPLRQEPDFIQLKDRSVNVNEVNTRLKDTINYICKLTEAFSDNDYPDLNIAILNIKNALDQNLQSMLAELNQLKERELRREAAVPELRNPETAVMDLKIQLGIKDGRIEDLKRDQQESKQAFDRVSQEKEVLFHVGQELYGFLQDSTQLAEESAQSSKHTQLLADLTAKTKQLASFARLHHLPTLFGQTMMRRQQALQNMLGAPAPTASEHKLIASHR